MTESGIPSVDSLSAAEQSLLAELLAEQPAHTWPLVATQAEMLDIAARFPDSRAAGIHLAIHLEGRPSLAALHACHNALLKRHPALRTTFGKEDGRWRQIAGDGAEFPLVFSTAARIDRELIVEKLSSHRATGFDLLGGGPLAHAELVSTRGNSHLLLWSWHHAVVDGYSLGVLWDDFAAAYNGDPMGETPTPFGTFAEWQQTWLDGPECRRAIDRLAAALDTGSGRSAGTRPNRPDIAALDIAIDTELHHRLASVANHAGVTLHMLLLAAYRESLCSFGVLTPTDPVWTPMAGRTDARYARTVGMFANLLPVSGTADGATTRDTLRANALLAMECQTLPRSTLAREIPALRAKALFALQNTPSGTGELSGLTVSTARPPGVPAVAPILEFYSPAHELFGTALSFGFRQGGLAGVFEFDRGPVPEQLAAQIVADIRARVDRIAAEGN